MSDIIVKLEQDELEAVQDHLFTFGRLLQQQQQIQEQMRCEARDVQTAFSNAMRRDMLDRGVKEDIPAFVTMDGTVKVNMTLDKDGNVRWVN